MHKAQEIDPFCWKVIKILQGTGINSKFRFKSRSYCMKDNLLYRISCRDGQKALLLVIPKTKRKQVLQYAHDECAHQGITRTYERLHLKYYWPGMLTDVARCCQSCKTCQVKR